MGVVAWMTGASFIFPSLGPTAYILAFDRKVSHSARVVIGGHACGVAGGLAGYHLIATPHTLMILGDAFALPALLLGLAAVVSIALTSFLMLWLKVSHPPACATTLIISLAMLSKVTDGLVILLAVSVLYAGYWILQKSIGPSDSPDD